MGSDEATSSRPLAPLSYGRFDHTARVSNRTRPALAHSDACLDHGPGQHLARPLPLHRLARDDRSRRRNRWASVGGSSWPVLGQRFDDRTSPHERSVRRPDPLDRSNANTTVVLGSCHGPRIDGVGDDFPRSAHERGEVHRETAPGRGSVVGGVRGCHVRVREWSRVFCGSLRTSGEERHSFLGRLVVTIAIEPVRVRDLVGSWARADELPPPPPGSTARGANRACADRASFGAAIGRGGGAVEARGSAGGRTRRLSREYR